ncbi:hypothetical protein N7490_011053 [Penicillium lividum]|nr:hypothetical protein N7490_011053 [Penicillium lividum]
MNKRPQESHPAEEADDRHVKERAPNATTTGPSMETPSYDTKETFRIRDIPESYSVEELCKGLQVTLKWKPERSLFIHYQRNQASPPRSRRELLLSLSGASLLFLQVEAKCSILTQVKLYPPALYFSYMI